MSSDGQPAHRGYQWASRAVRVVGVVIAAASFYWMWTTPLDFGVVPLGPIALGGLGLLMMDYELALTLAGRRGWSDDD